MIIAADSEKYEIPSTAFPDDYDPPLDDPVAQAQAELDAASAALQAALDSDHVQLKEAEARWRATEQSLGWKKRDLAGVLLRMPRRFSVQDWVTIAGPTPTYQEKRRAHQKFSAAIVHYRQLEAAAQAEIEAARRLRDRWRAEVARIDGERCARVASLTETKARASDKLYNAQRDSKVHKKEARLKLLEAEPTAGGRLRYTDNAATCEVCGRDGEADESTLAEMIAAYTR